MADNPEQEINRLIARLNELRAVLGNIEKTYGELLSASAGGGLLSEKSGLSLQQQKTILDSYNKALRERLDLVEQLKAKQGGGTGVNISGGYQPGDPVHTPVGSSVAKQLEDALNTSKKKQLTAAEKLALAAEEQAKVEQAGARLSHKLQAQQRTADEKINDAKNRQAQNEQRKVEEAGGRLSARLKQQQANADQRTSEQQAAYEKRVAKIQADSINEWNKALAAEKKKAKAAEEEAAKRQELANLQSRIANDPAYRNYLDQLRRRGLDVGDIKSAENRGGDITRVNASRMIGGIEQKYNAFVNERTGSSTPGLSSQFRSFGSDILRDIGQFTKWSIAVAAVYTPMQKLGELMTIMIDNESRLADAAIAANIPFEKSGEIFDTVAVSANQAGEGINTTIDAYTQAIRAAGRYNTEQEKSQKGLALLNDSLILSKLSTLDQANSIDTLSAALLQSERELDQGQELLNKWVRISQVANVTIDGLATGVAVLGDSAETVGLSIDQLNGLIAVLSEQSISGAKEAANTAKALVGAYQSDKAEAALNKYGVALRKANGEVRGFLEIYQELAALRQQGILSEAAVSEVALALGGGGVRRAKDASALINSTERLNDLAAESAKITGEDTLANDALSKKLETVQTANTRLANSFQELAQTLGDDGGILDSFKGMINLLTGVTKATNDLFAILGRSGPILATFVTGLAAMNAYYSVGGRKDVALARLGATGGGFSGFGFGLGGGPGGAQYGKSTGGGILADILRMNYRGASVIGAAGVGLQAASNVQAGKLDNAGANIVGGAIGGAIGAYLGGPAGLAIGSNVGSAVGDSFINAVFQHSKDLQDYLLPKDLRPGATEKDKPTQVELDDKSLAELLDMASKEAGIGGNLKAFFAATVGPGFGAYGGKKESALLEQIKTINPSLYSEIQQRNAQQQAEEARRKAEANVTGAGGAEFDQRRRQNEELASRARQEQLNRLATGQITSAEFGRISSQLAGFPAASIKSIENFGDELAKVSDELDTSTEAYDAFLYISTYGTQEQINNISQYSDDILKLTGYLNVLKEDKSIIGTEFELSWGKVKIESPEQLQKLISDAQKAGSTAFGITLQQVQESQGQAVKLPPLVGDYNKPLTGQGQDASVRRGLEIQEKYLIETGKTAEEIAKFKQAIEEFYAAVDRGLGTAFEPVEGLTQQFYDLGKAAAEAAGELESLKGFGLQQFDVDRGTLERLAQQSVQIGSGWAQQFPGFETKPEDLLAITNDGIAKPIHADFRILALLLEKIVDQNQKQLDGQYNIPEGATFWVPLTAAYYRNKGGDTGIGGVQSMLDSLAVDSNTGATEENTRALMNATDKWSNIDPLLFNRTTMSNNEDRYDRMNDTSSIDATNRSRQADAARYTGLAGLYGYNPIGQKVGEEATVHTTAQTSVLSQLVTELKNAIIGAFSQREPAYGGSYDPRVPAAGRINSGAGRDSTSVNTTPTTKLDLNVSSNINLMVDGRVLASTLQSYLASELLRTEQSQGTISRRFVI